LHSVLLKHKTILQLDMNSSFKPFVMEIKEPGIEKSQALVIGDTVRRDPGGASAAGIDCVLVEGAAQPDAIASFPNLLEFSKICLQESSTLNN